MTAPIGTKMQLEAVEIRQNKDFPFYENVWRATSDSGGNYDRVVVMTDALYQRICRYLAKLQELSNEVVDDPIRMGSSWPR